MQAALAELPLVAYVLHTALCTYRIHTQMYAVMCFGCMCFWGPPGCVWPLAIDPQATWPISLTHKQVERDLASNLLPCPGLSM